MWTLIKKESLENILTLRFLIGFVACAALFGITTTVLVNDFKADYEIANAAIREVETQIEEWTVFSRVRPTVIRMPSPLSVFGSKNGARWGTRMLISQTRIPAVASDESGEGQSSNFLGLFRGLDFAEVVQICISLLAILLTFDAISGEKERASLRLILSNPVGRTKLITSKFLGAVIALVPIFVFGFVVALVVFQIFSPVGFSADDWGKTGLLLVLILLYGAAFAAIGLLISAFTHSSATSLAVSMFVWIVIILVIPNAIGLFVSEMGFNEDSRELSRNLDKIAGEHGGPVSELLGSDLPFRDYKAVLFLSSGGPRYEGLIMFRLMGPNAVEFFVSKLPEIIRDQSDYATDRFGFENEFLQRRFDKIALIGNLQRVSPTSVFAHAANAIAGTDVNGYKHFLEETKNYRQELLSYIEGMGGFTSKRWFTDDYPGGPLEDLLQTFETMTAGQQLLYFQTHTQELMDMLPDVIESVENDPRRKLDLSDMPRFEMRPISLYESVSAASFDMLLLVVFIAACLTFSYIRFLHYDVR
ncbi:MAG TPA: ABC transporter permease subunit [Acidobacteriota bacterium]|nr:ABC transporter permease subunit [Acidobacteriota bacterium]